MWLHHPDGKPRHITPAGAVRFRLDLCETRRVRIQAGDHIRWTRNERDRGLTSGERAAILSINQRTLQLRTDDGRTLEFHHDDPQLRYIEHAYASAMRAAQRLAQDDVIVALDSGHGLLSNQRRFYLEVSRARDNVVALTDNHEQLMELLEGKHE